MVLTKIGASLGGSADIINVVQTSHTFVSGDRGKAVYMNDNSGTPQYVLAIATATTTADAIGIIINVADGNNFTLALSGRITVNACIPSGAAGTVLFLSHTAAGVLTATEPSAAGHVSKPMAVITIAGSEMIMLQQRGEVISSGATDNHTVVSHSDTSATGLELDTLTDGSTTALHVHAGAASDTAYASSWNGVTTIPPSKNAVYDKIETLTVPSDTAYASSWNGVTTIAPSKNAVYDKIEAMGGAGLVLINTAPAAASNASTNLEVTGLSSTYDTYLIAISAIVPVDDNSSVRVRLGAGSIDTGGSDYTWHTQKVAEGNTSYSAIADSGSSHMRFADNVGNAAGEGFGAVLWLHRPGDGTTQPFISGTYAMFGTSTNLVGGAVIGHRQSVIAVDRIQVSFGSGNIQAGRLTVWGLKHD